MTWAWLRAILACLCVSAQLAGACHFVLVTHTRCAHGELIHADHDADEAVAGKPVNPCCESATPVLGAAHGDHDEGHDHCVVSQDRRQAARSTAAVGAVAFREVPAGSRVQSVSVVRLAVYRTAPKTSPPLSS